MRVDRFSVSTPNGVLELNFSMYTPRKERSTGFFGWIFESDADIINRETFERNRTFAQKVKKAIEESHIGDAMDVADFVGRGFLKMFLEGTPIPGSIIQRLAHDLHELASLQKRLHICALPECRAEALTQDHMKKLWCAFEQNYLALSKKRELMEDHVMVELCRWGYPQEAFSEGLRDKCVDVNLAESDWEDLAPRIWHEAREFFILHKTLERRTPFEGITLSAYLKEPYRLWYALTPLREAYKKLVRHEMEDFLDGMETAGIQTGILPLYLQKAIRKVLKTGVPLKPKYREALSQELKVLEECSCRFLSLAKSKIPLKPILVGSYESRDDLITALKDRGYMDVCSIKENPQQLVFSTISGLKTFDLADKSMDAVDLQKELNHYCIMSILLHQENV